METLQNRIFRISKGLEEAELEVMRKCLTNGYSGARLVVFEEREGGLEVVGNKVDNSNVL